MLTKLALTNFRRHRDLTVDFSNGMNVVRSGNEMGKSTCLEGVAYALFGTKALRTPLDQTVTWGEDTKTLKVELTITVEGKVYTFSRSKAGAEVTLDGNVFCTGQNEVTALAATLLGADANTASKLMLANQGSIRGALDGGPKELSVLIEELGGMNVFDQILDAAQNKLALGSPALLEERLKGAESTLEAALQNLPVKPDAEQHAAAIKTHTDKIEANRKAIPDLEKKAAASEKAWREASKKYMDRITLEARVSEAENALARANVQAESLAGAASTLVTDCRPALRQELAEAEDFSQRKVAHRFFTSLPTGERYDGSAVEFESVAGINAKEKSEVEREIERVARSLIMVKAKRINHDKCDKCGQDVTHLAHVVSTNAAVDAEVATLTAREAELSARLATLAKDYVVFTGIERFAKQYTQGLAKVSAYVTLDESTYPGTATWNGSVPQDGPDVSDIKARLSKVEAEIKAVESAQAKYELAVEQQTKAKVALEAARQAFAKHESPDADAIVAITETKDNDSLNLNAAKGEIIMAEQEIASLKAAYDSAVALWSMAQGRIDDAKKVIDECKADLGSLSFNNNLVKRLRAIRPIITNKVWSSVLASVSVMFSQMRGEPSVVTKEMSGFFVNGQAVASLSGSTLDLLGLALRVALTRTFIPGSGLLVLDEACAAMDADRTESLLGFVASAGYQQVVLVTHEEISSSLADNLIQI